MTIPGWIPVNAIPNVEILPHWQAKYFTPGGMAAYDAAVWHFAQGGGTDTWLLHPTNDNSSHIVLKYDASIRQMVSLHDASHSLHIDRPDGPPGPGDDGLFSLDSVQRVLGTGWANPNTQIVTIEIEGYAANGPSAEQRTTIQLLARYLESLFPNLKHLGHRDFQDYKPCPGPYIFNEVLPHAGRLTAITQETEVSVVIDRIAESGTFTIEANAAVSGFKLDAVGRVVSPLAWTPRATPSSARYSHKVWISSTRGDPFLLVTNGTFAGYYIAASAVTVTPDAALTQAQFDQLDAINVKLLADLATSKTEVAALKAQVANDDKQDKEIAAQLSAAAAKLAA